MKIEQARLDRILGIYKPECRYLKEACLDSPKLMTGRFEIPASFYVENTGHFNAVELFICYNQLAYVFLDEASRLSHISEPNCQDMDVEELRKMQLERCFICSVNNMKFTKIINPNNFYGQIEMKNVRRAKERTFYKTAYDFDNGSARGEILLVKLR